VQVTPNPDFTARFNAALVALNVASEDRILVAVSGGPDSVALLLLAVAVRPRHIIAATVDHQLRPESADEAAYVANICARLGVAHVILTPEYPLEGNVQSSARTARYALLHRAAEKQFCVHIATAHHADDQLETILMRLARGSGVDGLSAIRARNGKIIRPLLGFTKHELVGLCETSAIETVSDPSNDNADFARVAMRQYLASTDHPFKAERATRTTAALAEASDALAWMTDCLVQERVTAKNDEVSCDTSGLPAELKRRLLLRALAMMDPHLEPRGDAIDLVLFKMDSGASAMIGDIVCQGGPYWKFARAPARRSGR
jgi:tRNA(Ile)-lysidine synthase